MGTKYYVSKEALKARGREYFKSLDLYKIKMNSTSIENHMAQSADLQSMTLLIYTAFPSMEMRLRMMHSSSLEHSCF